MPTEKVFCIKCNCRIYPAMQQRSVKNYGVLACDRCCKTMDRLDTVSRCVHCNAEQNQFQHDLSIKLHGKSICKDCHIRKKFQKAECSECGGPVTTQISIDASMNRCGVIICYRCHRNKK